jgi:hypothetical protein
MNNYGIIFKITKPKLLMLSPFTWLLCWHTIKMYKTIKQNKTKQNKWNWLPWLLFWCHLWLSRCIDIVIDVYFFVWWITYIAYLWMKQGSLFCFVTLRCPKPHHLTLLMGRGALTWFKIIWSYSVEAIDYWTIFSMKLKENQS